MSIITKDIFKKGELSLPIDNYGTGELQYYIDEHEPIILKELLAYSLYKDFIDGLAEAIPDQKWIDLRDGSEYTYNSTTNEYLGIKQMIADYVFSQIVADKMSTVNTNGVSSGESENTLPANPRYKQKYGLNDLVDRQVTLNGFILSSNETDSTTYEDYDPTIQVKVNVLNI